MYFKPIAQTDSITLLSESNSSTGNANRRENKVPLVLGKSIILHQIVTTEFQFSQTQF